MGKAAARRAQGGPATAALRAGGGAWWCEVVA